MRVPNMMPDVQYAIEQSEQSLLTATQQVSTGKRVNQLSDDPSASASMVRSLAASAYVDQYTANAESIAGKLQTADSALGSVVTLLNQAITLGTEGANGTESPTNRQEIATQVQSILSSVLSQANITFQGTYLFGGSVVGTAPFTQATGGSGAYVYVGNSSVNSVQIEDSTTVPTNVPGDQIFTAGPDVLASLNNLVVALQTGTTAEIGSATNAISQSLTHVDQQRVFLSNAEGQVSSQETYLGQESLVLSTQQASLVGVDLATAATSLSQAELDHSAVLGAAAKVLPETLLDYLR